MQKAKKGITSIRPGTRREAVKAGHLSMWSLVLLGVGGIIGAGFFLGCGLPISLAGPGVLLAFIVGALITASVAGAVTSIAVNHPVSGSFQVFAEMYLGRFAAYIQGWTFYLTSILTIASESVAMAIFVRYWVTWAPEAVLACVFTLLVVGINAFGSKNFESIESIMSVVKIAALAGFIVVGALLIGSRLTGGGTPGTIMQQTGTFLPHGWSGVMQSMLIVVFAYAGIGVFATAAPSAKHPRDIDKAAVFTIVVLTILYLLSIGLLFVLVPRGTYNTNASPFVVALQHAGLQWVGTVLNGVILVAAFSVMAGSLFAANQILLSLGASGDAPKFTSWKSHKGVGFGALITSTCAILLAIVLSVLLPSNVYNFLISASTYFTLFNWFVILMTFLAWTRETDEEKKFVSVLSFGQPYSIWVCMVLLIALAAYSLRQSDQRIGFYAALGLGLIVSAAYLFVRRGRHVRSDTT